MVVIDQMHRYLPHLVSTITKLEDVWNVNLALKMDIEPLRERTREVVRDQAATVRHLSFAIFTHDIWNVFCF